jgi:hypothetical protein
LIRRLGGPQIQTGHFEEEKNLIPAGIGTPYFSSHRVVAILTMLLWLPEQFCKV